MWEVSTNRQNRQGMLQNGFTKQKLYARLPLLATPYSRSIPAPRSSSNTTPFWVEQLNLHTKTAVQVWDELQVHWVDNEYLTIKQRDGKEVKIDTADGNSAVGVTPAEARSYIEYHITMFHPFTARLSASSPTRSKEVRYGITVHGKSGASYEPWTG